MSKTSDFPLYDELRMAQNALHEAKTIKVGPVILAALQLYVAGLKLERQDVQLAQLEDRLRDIEEDR
jgi:hypothetical protein